MEDEKRRVNLRLVDLIWNLDLKPGRFRKCLKCGKYFYQPASRERNYCSTKGGEKRESRGYQAQVEDGG
jgi:uncharacterized OB-fold protein